MRHSVHGQASWCGGQDSNLRTDKDCDLNAAPLTKLGDPRGNPPSCLLFIKQQSEDVRLCVDNHRPNYAANEVKIA